MLKIIINSVLVAGGLFMAASCNDEVVLNPGVPGTGGSGTEKETIRYRALCIAEKDDVDSYGGETVFRSNLDRMFRNTTRFWNESPNRFEYYFEWVVGDLQIYDMQDGETYDDYRHLATGEIDTGKYDFTVFLALRSDRDNALSCGGGGASGQSIVWAYFTADHNIFTDAEYPDQGTYSNLGHEYGHVRGAQDLYQYMITAENNPVSHEAYPYPECNMGTGYMVWSDYCSALFNFGAHMKQLPADFARDVFPDKVSIKVLEDGEPVRATVKLYGTRAGGDHNERDVYAEEGNSPFLEVKTDRQTGIVEFPQDDTYSIYDMYNRPDRVTGGRIPSKSPVDYFPFSRWYCFLVEATAGTRTAYAWLSDLDMVPVHLETGEETYELVINL